MFGVLLFFISESWLAFNIGSSDVTGKWGLRNDFNFSKFATQ
jgi:hypothetical protein